MIGVLALILASATSSAGMAAVPAEGTLGWGDTVTWSGELTAGGAGVGAFASDMALCPEGACDDFLLDIQMPPSPNPNRVRFVDITIDEIVGEDPFNLDLMIFPPGADLSRDFTQYFYSGVKIARLLDPQSGVWRIQMRCTPQFACADRTTYRGGATTGDLRLPRAVAHLSGGRPGPDLLEAPRARLRPVGANAFEPTMGIRDDGSILYQGRAFAPKVLRSSDGGRNWKNVSPRLGPVYRHPVTVDPLLHLDEETSRVFTVDLLGAGCTALSFTDDGGEAWTTTEVCEHDPDHQTLFTGPPALSTTAGYPNVVYWCVNGYQFTTAACSKSLDGGLTFVPTGSPPYTNPWPIEENKQCSYGATGHGVVGPQGTVYVPRGHCGQPLVAISHDEGLTWTRVQVADNGMPVGSPVGDAGAVGEHEASIAVDEEGTLYYAWVAYDRLPYLATSKDGGVSWTQPMMVGAPGVNEAAFPAIDVGAPGKVAIAYMATKNSPGGPPFPGEGEGSMDDSMRPGYEGVTWDGYITVTSLALEAEPVFLSATVNDPADPLVVGTCGPHRCAQAGDFFDVVIAPDGTPWAAFVDACVVDQCQVGFGEGVVGRLVGGPSLR